MSRRKSYLHVRTKKPDTDETRTNVVAQGECVGAVSEQWRHWLSRGPTDEDADAGNTARRYDGQTGATVSPSR